MHIGRFKVVAFLGAGGMAQIFRCQLQGIGGFDKTLLVKRIRPELLDKSEFVAMFLDEARLAARLSHPNIVQVYEVGEDNGVPFLAMELVRGPNLGQLLRKASKAERLDLPATLKVLSDTCLGLDHAHSATGDDGRPLGIVHRDISPQNIAVSVDGVAKLLDFGVAKAEGRLTETRVGTLKGKLGYMAPEQMLGEAIDRRADVFAIGVCLYTVATGAMPFRGSDEIELMRMRLSGDPARPSAVFPDIDPELERIIMRAMARPLSARYPDALALHEDLECFLARLSAPPTTKSVAKWVSSLFPNPDELFAGQSVPTPVYSEFRASAVTTNPWERSSLGGAPAPPSDPDIDVELSPTYATPVGEIGRPSTSQVSSLTGSYPGLEAPHQQTPSQTPLTHASLAAPAPTKNARPLAAWVGALAVLCLLGGLAAWVVLSSGEDEPASPAPLALAQSLFAEAEKLQEAGEHVTALDVIGRAKTTPGLDAAGSLESARRATELEVKSHLGLAQAALARGDHEAARERVDAVLERDADNAGARRILDQIRAADTQPAAQDDDEEDEEEAAEPSQAAARARPRPKSKRLPSRGKTASRPLQEPADALDDEAPASASTDEAEEEVPAVAEPPAAAPDEERSDEPPVVAVAPAEPEPPKPKPAPPVQPSDETDGRTNAPAAKPALPKTAPRSSLPARYRVRTTQDIAAMFRKIEGELIRAGLPSSKVRGVTVPLARKLATHLSPSSGADVYPAGAYAYAYEKLVAGKSKGAVAQALLRAHESHVLDDYRSGR